MHAVTPAGEDFVRVGLVAHVPDQAVFGGVENIMQGHCELHRAQVGAQMSAGARDALQQVSAQFVSHALELVARHQAQVGRAVDGF